MFYERTSRSASHFYERSSQYSFRRFPLAQGLWSGALPLRRRDALHDLCHGPLLLPDNGPLRELGGNLPLVLHTWNIFRNGTNGHLCSFRAISILTPEDANFRPQSEEAATSTRSWALTDSSATDSQPDHSLTIHATAATRFTISAMAFHCTSFLERGHEVFTPKLQFPLIFSTGTFIPNGTI